MQKRDFTLTTREVGPAANTENVLVPAEREVGPAYKSEKDLGPSAREVGPATKTEEILGSAEREVVPAAIPCCTRVPAVIILPGMAVIPKPNLANMVMVCRLWSGLTKKLGCPLTAILLAENDETVRRLVCAEFGYRTDEKWGYTASGSACLYIADVHELAENDCLLLRQLTAPLFPGLKWFIVGGSPCQELTYAGYLQSIRPGWSGCDVVF